MDTFVYKVAILYCWRLCCSVLCLRVGKRQLFVFSCCLLVVCALVSRTWMKLYIHSFAVSCYLFDLWGVEVVVRQVEAFSSLRGETWVVFVDDAGDVSTRRRRKCRPTKRRTTQNIRGLRRGRSRAGLDHFRSFEWRPRANEWVSECWRWRCKNILEFFVVVVVAFFNRE